jgi:tetratricopeptide (TPR) repeat protein
MANQAPQLRRGIVCALLGVTILAGGAVAYHWWRSRIRPAPVSGANFKDEDDEPAVPDPGYLGPQACAPCHADRVAEFLNTSHYRTSRVPQQETMGDGFASGTGIYATRDPGLHFEVTRAGDAFRHTAVRSTASGKEERLSADIDLVYGTGLADLVYFTWRGDGLYELPIVWLQPQHRWGCSPEARYGEGDCSRGTTPRCLECHNTWFAHVPGTSNHYRRETAILGVTCERCHGPGREHVTFHQAHPERSSAHAIVHPGRLTREQQTDVCAQCHSNATKRRGPAFSYRPGQPLEAAFRIAVSKHPELDHVANQVRYMRQSKCYLRSETLTCTTCHNPHRSARRGSPAHAAANQSECMKCHKAADCAEQPRLPAAVRNNCVGCHMPEHIKINVWFDTEEDQYVPPIRRHEHQIGIYPHARQEVLREWHRSQSDPASQQEADRLTKALVAHWLDVAEKYRQQQRFLAAVGAAREAVRLDPSPATRAKLQEAVATRARLDADLAAALHLFGEQRFPESVTALNKLLSVQPELAIAHGKLGTAYEAVGQREQAILHWQAVARCDPDDAYGFGMLGWLAFRQNRAEDAVAAFRQADAIEPYSADTNYKLGLALLQLRRVPDAVQCFRRVIAIDPNHAGGCQGLSHALRGQGQPSEALRYARRAARLTEFKNPDVLLTLADCYADVGRLAEADETATRALDAAQGNPQVLSQIRWRVEEIRSRVTQAAN